MGEVSPWEPIETTPEDPENPALLQAMSRLTGLKRRVDDREPAPGRI
jgi:hypothetical protein